MRRSISIFITRLKRKVDAKSFVQCSLMFSKNMYAFLYLKYSVLGLTRRPNPDLLR